MIDYEAENLKLKLEKEYKTEIKKLRIRKNISFLNAGLTGSLTIGYLGAFINEIINSSENNIALTLFYGGFFLLNLNQTKINIKIIKKTIIDLKSDEKKLLKLQKSKKVFETTVSNERCEEIIDSDEYDNPKQKVKYYKCNN